MPSRTEKRKPAKPTREQAKAWLSTVIRPMLNALEGESDRVRERSWSFRANRQDFEFLGPTEMMVARPFLPNLKQYLRYDAGARQLVSSHDTSLDRLREACRAAYARLSTDESFKQLMSSVSGADPRYFAEYVVNGVADLPSNYSNADDWNRLAQDFLALRGAASLRPAFDSVDHAGDDMRDSVRLLGNYLNEAAEALADSHGLPMVAEPAPDWEIG